MEYKKKLHGFGKLCLDVAMPQKPKKFACREHYFCQWVGYIEPWHINLSIWLRLIFPKKFLAHQLLGQFSYDLNSETIIYPFFFSANTLKLMYFYLCLFPNAQKINWQWHNVTIHRRSLASRQNALSYWAAYTYLPLCTLIPHLDMQKLIHDLICKKLKMQYLTTEVIQHNFSFFLAVDSKQRALVLWKDLNCYKKILQKTFNEATIPANIRIDPAQKTVKIDRAVFCVGKNNENIEFTWNQDLAVDDNNGLVHK